jgi:hypothetical protein
MTTAKEMQQLQHALADLKKLGWVPSRSGENLVLSPVPRLRAKFGLDAKDSFFFVSLEEARAWAQGFRYGTVLLEMKFNSQLEARFPRGKKGK